jgi:hypothetical protein
VPTSLQTNGTLKPRALAAERLVPAQPDEHSVDRNAGAFPANLDRGRGARATPGALDRDLGDRPLDERADPVAPKNVQSRVRLDELVDRKMRRIGIAE